MRYRQLGPHGPLVSELGFGASPLGGIYGGFAETAGIQAVHAALDAGITFFDVAPYYGLTAAETLLGKALHGIDRDRYVLATKVGRDGDQAFDFSAGAVTRSVRDSLARLGVDHVDLIQCHDVEFGSLHQVASETIPALRALQAEGLVRGVGITGYPLPALARIADVASVDTVMSYCQYTLQDRRLAASVNEFAAAGSATINASPLAMGALTSRGAPPWHPAPPEVLARCSRAAAVCQVRGADLAKLARSSRSRPARASARWWAAPARRTSGATSRGSRSRSTTTCWRPSRRSWRRSAIRAGSADDPRTRVPPSTEMAAQILDSHVHLLDAVGLTYKSGVAGLDLRSRQRMGVPRCQRERDRPRLRSHRQHPGASRRPSAERRGPRPHSGRPLGRSRGPRWRRGLPGIPRLRLRPRRDYPRWRRMAREVRPSSSPAAGLAEKPASAGLPPGGIVRA